ncbi:hypothetical protein BG004_002887 [Podila humilis]|nr:hypothetical protein BG004_002887 [Podila humilis]
MKLLLRLSLATALFTSALAALTLDQFIVDPRVVSLAPHLVQEISNNGIETYNNRDLPPITAGLKIPLIDDIVQIVALNIFNGKAADWSRLEAAKLKAIQEHGEEAMKAAADLTDVDIRHASLIVNTIYDTVIAIPATTKETYAARIKNAKAAEKKAAAAAEGTAAAAEGTAADASSQEQKKAEEQQQAEVPASGQESIMPSSDSMWSLLGFSLIKSQDTIKKAKSLVSPLAVCETTDTAYLKGVEDVVYYSSLTHGVAGSALVVAPNDSPLKSLDFKTIVTSVGKLALELHMTQSVARLADLNPSDALVRTMTYLALTSDSPNSQEAQTARDIHNLIKKGMADSIPESVIRALSDQAALILLTRGAGQPNSGSPSMFESIAVLRNVFAFSNEVLNANNMGDVIKYVFCPEFSRPDSQPEDTPPAAAAEEEEEEVAEGGEGGAAQKVLKMPEEAGKKVVEEVKNVAEQVANKAAEISEEAAAKAKEAEVKMAEIKKAADAKAAEELQKAAEAKAAAEELQKAAAAKAEEELKKALEVAKEKVEAGAKDAAAEGQKVEAKIENRVDEAAKKAGEEAVKNAQEHADKKAEESKEEL